MNYKEGIIYYREHIKDNNVFRLEFPEGPDIFEFKNFCIFLATELGYHPDNIKEAFGISSGSVEDIKNLKIIEYKIKF